MTPERYQRVRELYHAVFELNPSDRAAHLSRACDGDSDLRAEVESLLKAHPEKNEREDAFSESRLGFGRALAEVDVAAASKSQQPLTEHELVVGGYRILRKIGEGGMGAVYEAQQQSPQRIVALKIIRPGFGSPNVLRRFQLEAEVLARLNHPGIAHIYDAGVANTPFGPQPYYSMELIEGTPLTDHVNSNKIGIRDRLRLMADVSEAVHHAHQKGIIHRDLKPANILVDRSGRPKVLDFGIAHATDADLRLTTVQTGAGQLIGTLPYMSPEQVSGSPEDLDTRSDVYALGVLLHEVLTGRLPYELAGKSVPEAARTIRESDPARLSSVNRIFRGDIEAIVSKALAKDKDRRYESAAALTLDIRRYLADEPIEAKRDSAMYILRKQLRRYRGAAIAGVLLFALTTTFAIVSSLQSRRNRALATEEAAALSLSREEKKRADDALRELTVELRANHIERGRLLGLTGNFRMAEPLIWGELLRWPDCAAARWGLWELYSKYPVVASLPGHPTTIRSLAVSPDEHWIASGGADGCLMLWDAGSYTRRCLQEKSGSQIRAVAFSSDSTGIFSVNDAGDLRLWNRESGETLVQHQVHPGGAYGVARIADAAVVTVGADGALRLWNAKSLKKLDERKLSKTLLNAIASDRAGKKLAAAGDDSAIHRIQLIDSPDGPRIGPPRADLNGHTDPIITLAMSPDGTRLASGGRDRSLRIWRISDAADEDEAVLQPANGSVRALAFSADGQLLAETGWWTTDIWDMQTQKRISAAPMQEATWGVDFLGKDQFVIGDLHKSPCNIRIWEVMPRRCLRRISAHQGRCRAVAASPDGQLAASGGVDSFVRLWRLSDGSLQRELKAHAGVLGLRFSSDGQLIVSVCNDGWLDAWDVAGGKHTGSMLAMCGPNAPLSFLPESHKLLIGRFDGNCQVWDIDASRRLVEWRNGHEEVLSVLALPSRGLIATVGRERDISSGTFTIIRLTVNWYRRPDCTWTLATSARGDCLATGTWDNRVMVWDLNSHKQVADLNGHRQLVTGVVFGSGFSAELLASCSADGEIKLWDWHDAGCLATLDAESGPSSDIVFTPDGRKILAAYGDGSLGMWDLTYYDRHIENNRAAH